ncbi:MAG: hypothetical protein HC853_12560 [Anaerolineae bacterium]|nr:hypothetical protein [Anaerolineae bacterium]
MKSNIARFSALATWLSVVVISVVAVFLFDRPSLQGNSPDSAKRLELSLSIQQAQTAPTPLPVVPCSPGVMQYGKQVDFNCTADTNNNFDWVMTATVTTSCPVNLVFRNPYPRTMVNLTTTFSLTGSQFYPSPNGAWSNLVSAEKDVNYSPSRAAGSGAICKLGCVVGNS